MRLNRSSFLIIVILFITGFIYSQAYNEPESAAYDPTNDRYLITNKGNGDIISVPRLNTSNLSFFYQGTIASIRGIFYSGGPRVYAAGTDSDNSEIFIVFNAQDGSVIHKTVITEGDFVNDVTLSDNQKAYVSDNNNIYEIELLNDAYTYTVFLQNAGANGLYYEVGTNKLLFTDDRPVTGSAITEIDPWTKAENTLITNANFQWLDGLTEDHLGNYYVSCWSNPNAIYRYDADFTGSQLASNHGTQGVADIFFDKTNQIMVAPNMNTNTVDFIAFSQLSTEGEESIPQHISLYQNFPNPFNPTTSISYDLSKESSVKLTVFDLLGSEVVQLVNQQEQPGSKVVQWDGRNQKGELVNGGVYLYKLEIGDFIETKKMVLLK